MSVNFILSINELKLFSDSSALSLDIDEGTITSIFGMNGTGKTLLLKSVFGIFKYHSGEITKRYNQSDIGILLQSPEDLLYKANIIDEAIAIVCDDILAERLLLDIGVSIGQSTFTLSDGQKRLIFIFGYLMSKRVMFFDEPFASVDKGTHKVITDKFNQAKAEGRTIIYTANRKNDTAIADNILELI